MLRIAKNIYNKAVIIGFNSSIKYHIVKLSPNDIVLFLFPYKTRKLKREFNTEYNRLSLSVCNSFTVFDSTRTDNLKYKAKHIRKLTEQSS